MKKRILGLSLCALGSIALLTACNNGPKSNAKVDNSGKVFKIACWNEEFRGFFNKYSTDEGKALIKEGKLMATADAQAAKTGLHIDGIPVVFTETPSKDGAYQKALDLALDNQAKASADEKIDMFLAEADYILKYADDESTMDIKGLGVTDMSNTYKYTVQAASDHNGFVKGVSFQCCPSGMIYNRTIAKEVLGTDDPAEVQKKVSDWSKFEALGDQMKAKGYYLTACDMESYRVFSNNASTPWVNDKDELSIPDTVKTWMKQAKSFVKDQYAPTGGKEGVWSATKTATIAETSESKKAFACFGPAWYYNFCMGSSKVGDWALCKGPQAHFWGGTWLLAATGSDNTDLVAKVMNQYINDEATMKALTDNENQFTNNKAYNEKVAKGDRHNEFLGGQNDTAIFVDLAKDIKFENVTIYDQYCNEGFQEAYEEYLEGEVTEEKALDNFYNKIKTQFANLKIKK